MLAAPLELGPGRLLSRSAVPAHRGSADAWRLLSYSGGRGREAKRFTSEETKLSFYIRSAPKENTVSRARYNLPYSKDSFMHQERKEWRGRGRGCLLSITPPYLGQPAVFLTFRHLFTEHSHASPQLHAWAHRGVYTKI